MRRAELEGDEPVSAGKNTLMTTNRTFADSEGTFTEFVHVGPPPCPCCKSALALYEHLWTSNDQAYKDTQYVCRACGYKWWEDGIDS